MTRGLPSISLTKATAAFNSIWYMAAFFAVVLLLSSCENDLKAIQKISAQEVSKPVNTTTGLDVIFSDSAKVKFRLTAPLMLEYIEKSYREMPKGLKVISYDAKKQQSSQIVAEYGIMRDKENTIELRRNVVASNAKGETFKSDELIWDKTKKEFFSNKPVDVTFANGTHLQGTNFRSDENMQHWTMGNTNGQIPVNQNFDQ
jgi:LPS export ABC transporter protein LptC